MPNRYCMYLRKSRADADAERRGEGETLARHKAALYELAKRQKIEITAVYEEIVSGDTIAARPEIQRLLGDVNSGAWDGVLCMEIERLARGDTIDQGIVAQSFKLSGTKIITPTKTYDPQNEFDEEYFEFSLFMSRREYKTINRRMQAGRIASVKEGNYIGSHPPFGYKKIRDYDRGSFTLEPVPEEAEAVRIMYRWYVNDRYGCNKIASLLNAHGIKPKRSDAWSYSSVSDILHNPIYIGKMRWNWRKAVKHVEDGKIVISRPRNTESDFQIYDALHPAIVEEELWNAAQQVKPSTRYNGSFSLPPQNPFSGIMYCGFCGHAMSRQTSVYGPAIMCKHKGCACVGSKQDVLEEIVLNAVASAYDRYSISSGTEQPRVMDTAPDEIELLKKEQKKLDTQMGKLYDLLEQGIYTPAEYVSRKQKHEERAAAIRERIDALEHRQKIQISREEAIMRLKYVLDNYPTADSAETKKELLSSIVSRINYKKTTRSRSKQGSDLSLELQFLF